ncbi:MAG: ABC transporter substrate-binding protein [Dehalococcoidia bacterium]|nr:ABC transporter substrate-binding protein [Dehalococcoidia bacterium]
MSALQFPSDKYLRGQLLESWELTDPTHWIFRVRKGVYFHNKSPVNGRELTAQDIMFTINRYLQQPASAYVNMPFQKNLTMTTPDKYTLNLTWAGFNAMQFIQVTWYPYIIAPESVASNPEALRDWRNEAGTGPYTLTDYVKGSNMYFTKFANYWAMDPLHPDNKLPYLDNINLTIVPDRATLVALVRTRKIDQSSALVYSEVVSLKQTNPDLRVAESRSLTVSLRPRADIPPFNDIRVRKAASMAFDRARFLPDFFQGSGGFQGWSITIPSWPETTPFDQLPSSTQEIYTYNPVKAKQLLAEAGYPNGFDTAILCTQNGSAGLATSADFVTYLKTFWDAVGIRTAVTVMDPAAESALRFNHQFNGVYIYVHGVPNMMIILDNFISVNANANAGAVNDPKFDSALLEAEQTFDPVQRSQKFKDLFNYVESMVWTIPVPSPYAYVVWQPWLKGYDGEAQMLLSASLKFFEYTWIDQSLKK